MKTICPKCLADEVIRVNLDDGDTLTCSGCDEEFTAGDLREPLTTLFPLLMNCSPDERSRPNPSPPRRN